jgi:hypothetical protein
MLVIPFDVMINERMEAILTTQVGD